MFGGSVVVGTIGWESVAIFSLLWFLVGIAVGNLRAKAPVAAPKGRPQQQRERGGRPQGHGGGQRERERDRGDRGDRGERGDRGDRGERDRGDRGERSRDNGSGGGGTGLGVELYVGNLPYETSDQELGSAFERYGKVLSVRMIENRRNGKPKGFGFVEMVDDAAAESAIKAMNGADFKGRSIVVNEAKSRMRND